MIKDNKKDHLLRSFLDSLYIEKGLSKNTVSSYKNDISSFFTTQIMMGTSIPTKPVARSNNCDKWVNMSNCLSSFIKGFGSVRIGVSTKVITITRALSLDIHFI